MTERETHQLVDGDPDALAVHEADCAVAANARHACSCGATDAIIAEARRLHDAARAETPRPLPVVILRKCFPGFAWLSDRWNNRRPGVRLWQPWDWLWNMEATDGK